MVDSISGGTQRPPPPPQSQSALTDEQSSTLNDILENYDAENLSDEDAQAIVSSLQEAGIGPSKALADKLADSGIDARALSEQAGLGQTEGQRPPPPPPPPPNSEESTSLFNSINITV